THGDRVAILSRNRPEWVLLDLAAMGRGAATVALDPGWSDKRFAAVLSRVGARQVFVETEEDAARVAALAEIVPTLRCVVAIESSVESSRPTFEDLIRAGAEVGDSQRAEQLLGAVDADDLASVMFTGGSTGDPKG